MKVLLLNGPPRCGKDTVASIIGKAHPVVIEKFAHPLRAAAGAFFELTDEQLEKTKRKDPRVRKFKIGLSENVVRPIYGSDYFGVACAKRVAKLALQSPVSTVIISDCGFEEEAHAFISTLQNETDLEAQLWQISRDNCTFSGDSRSWVRLPGEYGMTVPVSNYGSLDQLEETALMKAAVFLQP